MPELLKCQCRVFGTHWSTDCQALATQEDLLCDTCRTSNGIEWAMAGRQHMPFGGTWQLQYQGVYLDHRVG